MADEQSVPIDPTGDEQNPVQAGEDTPSAVTGETIPPPDLLAENQELKDKLLRTQAEWVNFRNRTEREKNELGDYIKSKVLLDILPVYENLQRALAATRISPSEGVDAMQEGVSNILEQFEKVLSLYGVTRIPTVGQMFDYNLHEALLSGDGPKDVILEELDPGYLMGERVLRVAKVLVGNGTLPSTDNVEAKST